MKFGSRFTLILLCLAGLWAGLARGQTAPEVDDATSPYIKSIALALNHDPVRIYEWVKNNVDFTPYYGFCRGAHLTALEREGNDFDTAALLGALLMASKPVDSTSWEVAYKRGKVRIIKDLDFLHLGQLPVGALDAKSWLSADASQVAGLLGKAEYNVSENFGSDYLTVPLLWVEFTHGDVTFKLTPALKRYTQHPALNLDSIQFSAYELLKSAAGTVSNVPGTNSATAYTGTDAGNKALRTRLNVYTSDLVKYVGANAHGLSGLEAVGGRSIEFSKITALPTSFPFGFTEMPATPEVPATPTAPATPAYAPATASFGHLSSSYCPRVIFKVGSLVYECRATELKGRKLAIWFEGNVAKLYIDDAATSVAQESGGNYGLSAKVEFSFGTDPEKMLKQSAASLARSGKYIISYGFGRVHGRLNERLRMQSDYVGRGFPESGRELMSENLYVMSLQYLNLMAEMNEIAGSLTGTRITLAFHAGIAGQKNVPYVDLPMNLLSVWPTRVVVGDKPTTWPTPNPGPDGTPQPAPPAKSAALAQRISYCASFWISLLEHTTIEQMLAGEGVSTVKMIQKSVQLNKPVYFAKDWNDYAAGVRPLLLNYPGAKISAAEIGVIEDGIRAGGSLLIPEESEMVYKLSSGFKGTGYMLVTPPDATSTDPTKILMGISGGMNGGMFSEISSLFSTAPVASTTDYYINPNVVSISSAFQSNFIQDPVDMTNGSFYHTVTDLALDGDSVHGLNFTRRYSSARRTYDAVGLGKGWTHSYNMQLEFRHPNDFSLPRASVAEVAPFIVALRAMADIYDPEATAREGVLPALIACWLGDQLINSRATVTLGEKEMDFVKLPDGTYAPPPGVSATLTKTTGGAHTLQMRKGSRLSFDVEGKCFSVIDENNLGSVDKTLGLEYNNVTKKLSVVTDAYGRTLTFKYAGDGRLDSVTDSAGRTVKYSLDYHQGNECLRVQDPQGNSTRYVYDDKHRIIELLDGLGRTVVTSKYNEWDQITEQSMQGLATRTGTMGFAFGMTRDTDPAGNTSWSYYDARGRVHGSVDPLGAVSFAEFDGNDRVTLTADPLGRFSEIAYDQNHEPILITDARNQTREIRPESDDSVTLNRREFNFEGLESVTEFYSFHKPKSVTVPGGITEKYEYDNRGRIARHHPASFADGAWITYSYQESGSVIKVTTTYPILAGASTAETEFAYFDKVGNVVQSIDRRRKKSTFEYDKNRRLVMEAHWSRPDSGSDGYDDAPFVNSPPPAGSLIRKFVYDANGDLIKEIVDGDGNIGTITDDRVTTSEYDAEGHPLAAWGPDGVLQVRNYYNTRGLLQRSVDAMGNETQTEFDAAGRPIQAIDELGREFRTEYDIVGRPIKVTSPRGYVTRTEYDELDRVRKVVDARNGEAKPLGYTYDKDGRQKSLRNRRAKSYTTDYADLTREVATKTPLDAAPQTLRETRTTTSVRGLPVTVVEPSNQTTTYLSFDQEGRVLLQRDGDGIHTKFVYGPGGLLESVREPVSASGLDQPGVTLVTKRVYDDFGRLTSYQDGQIDASNVFVASSTIGYAYDAVGNLNRIFYPDGFTVGYDYDAYGRMKTVMEWAAVPGTATAPLRTTTYAYDILGRLSSVTRPNNTVRTVAYDVAGQVLAIEEKRLATTTSLYARFFRYGEGGLDKNDDGSFNTANDLDIALSDGEITQTYTWPALASSSPANHVLTYNDDNQLASFNGIQFAHDKDGNLRGAKASGYTADSDLDTNYVGLALPVAGGATSIFSYDSRNRLKVAGGSTYRYNPDGLRIATTGTGAATCVVDPSGAGNVLSRTVGATTTRYVWGLGLLYEVTNGIPRYYHADQVGSTVALTDASGNVTGELRYTPFGELIASSGDTNIPFRYNGASGVETDANGLLYMRARYYHPALMRFINADPIRFGGGMNWYAFAGNNPMGYLDPTGTERMAAMAQSAVNYGMSVNAGILNGHGVQDPGSIMRGALDIAGLLPPLRVPANMISAAISYDRGEYGHAALSVASVVPIETLAAGASKLVRGATEMVESMRAERTAGKSLLPGEGLVGSYDDLIAAGSKGDNITPHHIPSANRMSQAGVSHGDAIAINMEHPFPGVGGRHRATFTYGTTADASMSARGALAAGVRNARQIYISDGLYGSTLRQALQNLIRTNKQTFPQVFAKPPRAP